MAEVDDNDSFTFGDFKFAPPSPQPHLTNNNGVFPTPGPGRVDPSPPVILRKPNGALPLSLFGEVEDEDEDNEEEKDDLFNSNHGKNSANHGKSNGLFDPNTGAPNGKSNPQIVSETGSGLNDHDHDLVDGNDDDDDEWEFTGAFSGNGNFNHGNNLQDSGGFSEKMVVMPLEYKAGQDASFSVEQKPGFSSFSLQSNDPFAVFPGAVNISSEKDAGFESTTVMTNGFVWDAFSGDVNISNGNGMIAGSTNRIEQNSGSNTSPQSRDLFGSSLVAGNGSSKTDVERKPTNGFSWDAFTCVEKLGNGSERSGTTGTSFGHLPRASSSPSPSDKLFVNPLEAVNNSIETDVGFKPAKVTIDSFGFDAFHEVEKPGSGTALSPSSANQKPGSSSFLPPSDDFFAVPQGPFNKSSESFGGFKPASGAANGFMFDAFPEVEGADNGNGFGLTTEARDNEDDDFDDFGDFVDASQEVRTREQQEQVVPQITVAETHLEYGKSQDKMTQLTNGREALPLSLFGSDTEETSETLNLSDEVVHKPTPVTVNGFSGQGPVVSIHDLISNLYSQVQSTPPGGSDGNVAENEVHNSQEKDLPPLDEDSEWEENSWEFQGAYADAGVREQPSSALPWDAAQTQLETSQNVQSYIDFYTKLRDTLCFLLSCQLEDLEKAQRPDTGTGVAEITETLDNEIQDAHELLKENMVAKVVPEKHLERSSCLNEVFEILQGPKFEMIESEYLLSKKLQLAVDDWRVATDLVKHAISILKTASIGSADELFLCASTWYKIIDVCAQELSYGALIWKRVSEKEVVHHVLSDHRGQKYIQALGEIYKIVELLRLSAKVYKTWMLFSVSDFSRFMSIWNECRALWLSSGLEEALQNLSDDVDFGCDGTARALISSIKNIRDFDVPSLHDCAFGKHKSICRLSLWPQEKLPDLKTTLWNGELYFLSLANLWANLVSCEPPQLPHLQIN